MATIDTTLSNSSRVYIKTTYGEPVVPALKAAGAHWDGAAKAWWVGAAKRAEIEAVLANAPTASGSGARPREKKDLSSRRCEGKVTYKNRDYYVIGTARESGKLWLTVLDGSIDFWADPALCTWIKRYQPRTYRGREEHTTLGSIQRFVRQQKDPSTRRGECYECGAYGPSGETCNQCHEGSYV